MKLEARFIMLLVLIMLMIPMCLADDEQKLLMFSSADNEGPRRTQTDTTWADIYSGVGTATYASPGGKCYIDTGTTASTWNSIGRAGYTFNTADIPDGAYITNAYMYVNVYSLSSTFSYGTSYYFSVVSFTPDSYTGIVSGDYDNFGNTKLNTYLASNYSAGNDYFIPVSTTLVNKTGYTGVGIRENYDIDNSPPSWESGVASNMVFQNVVLYVVYYDSEPEPETAPPTDIDVSPSSGQLPLPVTLTDNSTGWPESAPYADYTLYFGDGDSFTGEWQYHGEEWYHTYEDVGTYNITYIVSNESFTGTGYSTVTVTDTSANYYVQVHGLNTEAISGAGVEITYDGYLQDTEATGSNGKAYFTIPSMTHIIGNVYKSGYQNATFSQYINTWDTWTSVTLYTDNQTIPEEEITYGNLILTLRDVATNNLVNNTNVYIYEDSDRTTLYETGYTTNGIYTALVPMNTSMYYTVSAASYNDLLFSSNVTTSPTYATHYMHRINYASDIDGDGIPDYLDDDIDGDGVDNDTDTDDDGDGTDDDEDSTPDGGGAVMLPNLRIWVYSTSGSPISAAIVTVTGGTDTGSHVTNNTGYVVHYCDALNEGQYRTYAVSVSRGGYESQSATVNVSTQNPSVTFYLAPTTGATTSPTPTTIYTPVVLPTWSGTNGTPGTYKEQFLNFTMSQFGVDQFSAGVLIGLVLTLLSAVFVGGCLAGYGAGGNSAGIGAMIGGAFGWVASGMLGFIPLWALIVTVALVAMIFFIFLRGGGSGGG